MVKFYNKNQKIVKMSDVLFGNCPICGKEAVLDRTYFYYNIP